MKLPFQVHYGESVREIQFIKVRNEANYGSVYRPQGGYWLSDYTPGDEYPSPWMKFVYQSNDQLMIEHFNSPNYYVYQVKPDAKVYTIHTYDDLIKLMIKYPLKISENIYIDFEEISKDWDGIYLSAKGFEACKIPSQEKLDQYGFIGKNLPSLKGWDVPSFLVTNPQILILIEEKENDKYIEL